MPVQAILLGTYIPMEHKATLIKIYRDQSMV